MNIRITGAEFIGGDAADAEVLKHREPAPTAKISILVCKGK